MYNESWLDRMKKELAKMQAHKPLTLEDEIRDWWGKLPVAQRYPHYHMTFFTEKFSRAQQVIGPILYKLGWRRVRSWQSGPFIRLWIPPNENKIT